MIVPEGLVVALVYRLFNPKYVPYYVGKTKRRLYARLGTHRRQAKQHQDAFHTFMNATNPRAWEMEPILTLYNVTANELSAVEAWMISQRAGEIWNVPIIPQPFLHQSWCHAEKVKGKWKYASFLLSKRKGGSIEEVEQRAQTYAVEHPGHVTFEQKWVCTVRCEGKKLYKSVRATKRRTLEQAKAEMGIWITQAVAERDAYRAEVAHRVIQRSANLFASIPAPMKRCPAPKK